MRVVGLLAVAVRQRHERGRQADRSDLGDGVGACTAHDEVGGGVGEVHAVDERRHDVRRVALARVEVDLIGSACRVQHLHTGVGEVTRGGGDGLVDATGALRAAGHQQRRAVGIEPEMSSRLGPHGGAVEPGDLAPDREPDVGRVRQVGVGEARRDVLGESRAELVGDTRDRVALVHDQRDAATPGDEVGRHGDVPAEADDDIGLDPVDHLAGRLDRLAQLGGHQHQVLAGLARQRHGRHQLEVVAGLRDQRHLEAARRAEADDVVAAVAQHRSRGEER